MMGSFLDEGVSWLLGSWEMADFGFEKLSFWTLFSRSIVFSQM